MTGAVGHHHDSHCNPAWALHPTAFPLFPHTHPVLQVCDGFETHGQSLLCIHQMSVQRVVDDYGEVFALVDAAPKPAPIIDTVGRVCGESSAVHAVIQ